MKKEKSQIGDKVLPYWPPDMGPKICSSIKFPGDAEAADPTGDLYNLSSGFFPWSLSASLKFLMSYMGTFFFLC